MACQSRAHVVGLDRERDPGSPTTAKPLWYQPDVIKAKSANRMSSQRDANFLPVMGRRRSPTIWGLTGLQTRRAEVILQAFCSLSAVIPGQQRRTAPNVARLALSDWTSLRVSFQRLATRKWKCRRYIHGIAAAAPSHSFLPNPWCSSAPAGSQDSKRKSPQAKPCPSDVIIGTSCLSHAASRKSDPSRQVRVGFLGIPTSKSLWPVRTPKVAAPLTSAWYLVFPPRRVSPEFPHGPAQPSAKDTGHDSRFADDTEGKVPRLVVGTAVKV